MSRVAIVTLGCPKNAVDSEGLGGILDDSGHEVVSSPAEAEIALVNTCGFIDPARRETIQEVLELGELKRAGLKGIVMTGCLVARASEELAEALPEVDAFVDFAAYPRISEIVTQVLAPDRSPDQGQRIFGDPGTRFDPAWWDAALVAAPRLRFGRAPWAYVKIAEGCDRGCTFCAIPLMRGKLRSRSGETIEREARSLVEQGVSEISLVSQDSVMWGRDSGEGDLVGLLSRLERVDGLARIRLMYLHPHGVTDALIDAMLCSDVIVSYFDLSLQHVAAPVLKRMGRWGDRNRFERLAHRIRRLDPTAGLRSTFILGFPGETDREAAEVESFVSGSELDWIGVFTYSLEEGTRSFALPDRIPEVVARERTERVAWAAEEAMARRARDLIGTRFEVLVERFAVEEEKWSGRSHREAPEIDGEIRFGSDVPLKVGEYVDVRVADTVGADLIGEHATALRGRGVTARGETA